MAGGVSLQRFAQHTENIELESATRKKDQRSNEVSTQSPSRVRVLIGGFVALSFYVLSIYQRKLRRLGFLLARYQVLVLVASLILVAISCTGYMRIGEVDLTDDQFMLKAVQSRKDLDNAATYYPLLGARSQEIILRPKSGGNILKQECLEDATIIHDVVLQTSGYQNLCVKQSTNFRKNPMTKTGCIFLNPLELVGFQMDRLKDLPTIIAAEMETPSQLLSNGQTFRFSFKEMLGDLKYENGNETVSARTLRLVYFVTSTSAKEQRKATLDMEKALASRLASQNSHLKCASMTFMVAQMSDGMELELLLPEKWPYIVCIAVLFACGVLFTFLLGFSNWFVVALLSFSCIALGLACSTGIILFAGFPLSHFVWFLPFLMLGNWFTLALLASRELESRPVASDSSKFSDCLASVGPLFVATAVTDLFLFGIALTSSCGLISYFFTVALVTVLFMFLFIPSLILLLGLYIKNKKSMTPRWFSKTDGVSGVTSESSHEAGRIAGVLWRKVADATGQLLTSMRGKFLALLLVVGLFVISSLFAFTLAERFDTNIASRTDLNIRKFVEARKKFYGREVDVSLVLYDDLDYSSARIHSQIIQMSQTISQASYSARRSSSWMAALIYWANNSGISSSGKSFQTTLFKFLNVTENFKQDIIFKDPNSSIISSRLHLFMKKTSEFSADHEAMDLLREDLKNVEDVSVTAVSSWFTHLDELKAFKQESLLIFGISTAVVFVCTFFFTLSPWISFLLAFTFAFHFLEVTGILYIKEVPINQISFLTIFSGIVMSLNSNIYIAHVFVLSSKKAARDGVVSTLTSCGPPVLFGGMLNILGSVGLGFTFSCLVDVFHFVLPLLITIGLVHTFAIIAPLLSLRYTDRWFVTAALWKYSQKHLVEHSLPYVFKEHRAKHPSISIIGMSCTFARVKGKNEFWNMLVSGVGVVSEDFPSNRPEQYQEFHAHYHPKQFVGGRLVALGGAYMDDIRGFDSSFFGISPQEARAMDPQQRIQLQVVYEAIEDAGLRLGDLQKCRTGVFLGYMNNDYAALMTRNNNHKNGDQFASTGTSPSILANRISFCLNLTGPSLSVNTACSSSLTALQLACDSLHKGSCEAAIVCAPNIILDYTTQIISSIAGLLAPDGRCKSFDASGDGYGRGEGSAAVILKLTDAAMGDKDDIYCEIVASGMNSDGQNAIPITAPSVKMQSALIQTVLEESGLGPCDVDYFEAHGTGTAIGDVVETNAIAETYCQLSSAQEGTKLRIGSVKSNLNHTESTSGLAGLMKVALMIKHRMYVPTINIRTLNPKLKLDEKGLVVQQTSEEWNRRNGKPRIAAINSFGFGGSNVHAILRELDRRPSITSSKRREREVDVMTLSARSKDALRDMARAHAQWLESNVHNSSLRSDFCYSLNERRTQHPHRLALAFRNFEEATSALMSFSDDKKGWESLVSYGESSPKSKKIVFMFGGQGSQWYAMGRQLIVNEPAFRKAIIHINNLMKNVGEEWSLMDALTATEEESTIAENRFAQLATFAIQYATAELLKSLGILPSAVLGHSLGEFAAACTSGSITVQECLLLVLIRAKLQEKCPDNGAMAALGMSEETARNILIDLKLEETLDVAAVNDACSVTISGDADSVECLGNYVSDNHAGIFWRVLGTSRAFHSFHMETIKHVFRSSVKHLKLRPHSSQIPMYSTVTGDVIPGKQLDWRYWWNNMRNPVQFNSSVKHLLEDEYKFIIEISSQPILSHYVKQIALQENISDKKNPVLLATLPRKRVPITDQHKFLFQNTVCQLYTQGFPLQWKHIQADREVTFLRLPTYPWQMKRYWHKEDIPSQIINPLEEDRDNDDLRHPFLGELRAAGQMPGLRCWDTEIDLHRFKTFKDHVLIQAGAVMPGTAYLEMALAMARDNFLCQAMELKNVKLLSLLTLPEAQVRYLRLRLSTGKKADEAEFHISSVQDDQSDLLLCTGEIVADLLRTDRKKKTVLLAVESENCSPTNPTGRKITKLMDNMEEMPMSKFKELTENYGFNYGPAFSVIKRVWQRDNQGLCFVSVENKASITQHMNDYVVHPAILDSCLQSCFVPLANASSDHKSVVPVRFESITLSDYSRSQRLFCHVTMETDVFGVFNVILMSPQGKTLLSIKGVQLADLTSLSSPAEFHDVSYEMEWIQSPLQGSDVSDQRTPFYIVLKDSSGFGDALVQNLNSTGQTEVVSIDLPLSREFDNHAEESIKMAIETIHANTEPKCVTVVNLWPAETYNMPNDFNIIDMAQALSFHSSVLLLQTMAKKELHQARLVLVTRATQVIPGTSPSGSIPIPWGSSVWGLRRTATLEMQKTRAITVDLSCDQDACEVERLVDELLANSSENEIALRNGVRFINRIARATERNELTDGGIELSNQAGKSIGPLCLALHPKTETPCLKRQTLCKIFGDEIEVEVQYVWNLTESVIPLMKVEGCVFVCGRVSAVSKEPTHQIHSIGDDVCGVVAPGHIGNRLIRNSRQFFPRPREMTPEHASSLPACLAIAYHALQKLTGGYPGQRILIHEANRGPGPAAVLIARALGHTVCTTSEDDVTYPSEILLRMGAERVIHPSSFHFDKDLCDAVDAMLFFYDPLPNMIQQSSQLLKRGGKLLILSVQDGDLVLRGNTLISYERIDISETLLMPGKFEELFTASVHLLEQKAMLESLLHLHQQSIDVLQITTHHLEAEIFDDNKRKTSSTLVTTLPFSSLNSEHFLSSGIQILPPGLDEHGLKHNRTYVVFGGMRGYGFEVARWMAESGAKTIVLVARSDPSSSKVVEVSALEKTTGAKILMFQADISCPEQMESLYRKLQTLPSVAGMVHSAMVLRDELIISLDMNNFQQVMASKIKGGYLMHQMSLDMDLDFFVVFSSMASLFGNIGQASYAASNAFLDSLVQYRRHELRLPGLAINWGPIGGAGVMERDAALVKIISLSGLRMIQAKDGIQFMKKVLVEEPSRSQICLANVDWSRFMMVNLELAQQVRLERIAAEISTTQNQVTSAQTLAGKILLEKDYERRSEMVLEYVRSTMAFWTGMQSTSETDLGTSLYSYGIDSTAVLTLMKQFETDLLVSFEVFYFMQPETTILRMAKDINARLMARHHGTTTADVSSQSLGDISPTTSNDELIHEEETSIEIPSASEATEIVPLYTPESSAVKLFCVHPSHRFALSLAAFASGFQFQTTVSFHALGFTEPTVKSEDWGSVRNLAYEHVKLIKQEQRHGPYFLAGYSYGGLLAYEMASILTEQEEVVEFVAMIDTPPWYPTSQSMLLLIASLYEDSNSTHGVIQSQFEAYLAKLAVEKLGMTDEEYKALRQINDIHGIIEHLDERRSALNVPIYNLDAMYQSLIRDHEISKRTHNDWEPALVKYGGTLTYLKSSSGTHSGKGCKAWSEIASGNIDVYVCPGNHYSMSEMPHAKAVGGILATAVNFKYQSVFPQLRYQPRSFKHRRALQKFQSGVGLFLHSKKGRRDPHVGELVLQEEREQLVFREKGHMSQLRSAALKNISLRDVKIVLPGRFVQNALKYARKLLNAGDRHSGDINYVMSVRTTRRTYNMEFLELSDLKDFYSVVEAMFGVQIGVA